MAMKNEIRGIMLATVMLAAVPAGAQTPPAAEPRPEHGPGAMFRQIDANGDSRVTFAEGWTWLQARFSSADADHDGGVTLDEAKTVRPQRRPAPEGRAPNAMHEVMAEMMFRGLDANRDGKVTLEEIRPAAEAHFRSLDANGDNAVTLDELPPPGPRRRHAPTGGLGQIPG